MPFISSSEAKNVYFMSGEATNEIYFFTLHNIFSVTDFLHNMMSYMFAY